MNHSWLRRTDEKTTPRQVALNLFGLLLFALLLLLVLLTREISGEAPVELAPLSGLTVCNASLPSIEMMPLGTERVRTSGHDIDDNMRSALHGKLPILRHVEYLKTGTLEEKTHAALVLGIAAATSPDTQEAIVDAGAVEPLVDLLHADAPEARGQAAVALRTLASNNLHCKVVIERAGAIPLLMKLLRDESQEVQDVAAGALHVLVASESKAETAEADAIDSLAALLKDGTPGVREEAASALVILAMDTDDNQVREKAADALERIAAETNDEQVGAALSLFLEESLAQL